MSDDQSQTTRNIVLGAVSICCLAGAVWMFFKPASEPVATSPEIRDALKSSEQVSAAESPPPTTEKELPKPAKPGGRLKAGEK